MKSLIAFAVQQKILILIVSIGVASLSFQMWKYQDEQYQKFLANQQGICEKSLKDAGNTIGKSKALFSAYKPKLLGANVIASDKIYHPGINSQLQKEQPYILIRSDKSALIPANTPHYKNDYFEGYSKPPGGETIFAAIVTAEPLNDLSALVKSPCSPKPFAVPLKDLYETIQKNDFTPDGNFSWR
jgi:hypothetical protein